MLAFQKVHPSYDDHNTNIASNPTKVKNLQVFLHHKNKNDIISYFFVISYRKKECLFDELIPFSKERVEWCKKSS